MGTPSWLRSFHSHVPTAAIPPDVRDYVEHAIARVIRGPVPYRDFALAVDGGYVIGELTVPLGSPCPPGIFCPTSPLNAILEDVRIGQCWFVQRTHCQLGLALPAQVRPTFVSVEHIPKELAANPGQAPRRMVLWGVVEGNENNVRYDEYLSFQDARTSGRDAPPQTTDEARWVIISDFTYDINARHHIQTFSIAQSIRQSNLQFGIVVLEVMDNWGAESLCLYRVCIHGDPDR
ncbi:hypothetical protein LXA43DRAFT_900066 [Ganoderma leucocontextum]|nr:hypothetical protein LXA43DRAFT_900066 [Ganoderma leucocontextum]